MRFGPIHPLDTPLTTSKVERNDRKFAVNAKDGRGRRRAAAGANFGREELVDDATDSGDELLSSYEFCESIPIC